MTKAFKTAEAKGKAKGGPSKASPAAEPTAASDKPLVVIRGDLFSDSGYARATRAITAELAKLGHRLAGIPLHDHPSRRTTAFAHPQMTDDEVAAAVKDGQVIVINICTPEGFRRHIGAINIGYFFWETESFPQNSGWQLKLQLMDHVWAPSSWQAELMKAKTRHQTVPIVPWPQSPDVHPARPDLRPLTHIHAHAPMTLEQLDSYRRRASGDVPRVWRLRQALLRAIGVDHRFNPSGSPRVPDVAANFGTRFLAIQTDAPRKGLPLLLSAWFSFLDRASSPACLIIKTSSLDVGKDLYNQHFHNSLAVQNAAARWGRSASNIFFVYDRLDDYQLSNLVLASDSLVSATMGEGFGGPIADALLHERNVIVPRHTAIADLIDRSYPFAVAHETAVLKLWNNISIYSPSSTWRVIDDTDMAKQMDKLQRMRPERRRVVAGEARRRLLGLMGRRVVRDILAKEIEALRIETRP